jgi:PAS domain S-box-containing protein
MKPLDPKEKKNNDLRKRAEELLAKQQERLRGLSSTDLQKLAHELGTHQIELEMQNEELREARLELETSRNKYVELYDFSPIGYFTIDSRGLIRETNLTGAGMLGVDKRLLTGKPLAVFIESGDLLVYEAHREDAFSSRTRRACEVRINPRNAPAFHARLQSTIAEHVDDKAGLIRTALIDISERKRVEEEREKVISELQIALAKIKTLTGFLPICAGCKKIRNDSGYWQQVEQYITEHSDAIFTHGMCPDCYQMAAADLEKLTRDRKKEG